MKNRRIKLTQEQRQDMIVALGGDNPYTEDEGHSTICNHIRYLYTLITTNEQKELCQEIIFLAKKMDARLRQYVNTYGRLPK